MSIIEIVKNTLGEKQDLKKEISSKTKKSILNIFGLTEKDEIDKNPKLKEKYNNLKKIIGLLSQTNSLTELIIQGTNKKITEKRIEDLTNKGLEILEKIKYNYDGLDDKLNQFTNKNTNSEDKIKKLQNKNKILEELVQNKQKLSLKKYLIQKQINYYKNLMGQNKYKEIIADILSTGNNNFMKTIKGTIISRTPSRFIRSKLPINNKKLSNKIENKINDIKINEEEPILLVFQKQLINIIKKAYNEYIKQQIKPLETSQKEDEIQNLRKKLDKVA